MEKITILDANNNSNEVDVVRYFKYNNDYYLIFTYGESDETGKEKLYIVQILDELGFKVARNITDYDEWNNIQLMIKNSIKQIKKGNDDIQKLIPEELNSIKIEDPRSFKVDKKLVSILSSDDDTVYDDIQPEIEEIKPTNIDNENIDNEIDIDYKKMYLALKEDNDAAEVLLNELMDKLILYKEKYGELS